jgi:cell division protein FtsI (penicillin-binding protein 3)
MVLVLIDEPAGAAHFGAQVAGPPWLEVMVETLRYLGIPAGENPGPSAPESVPASGPGPGPGSGTEPEMEPVVGEGAPAESDDVKDTVELPDLSGLGVADALEMAGTRCASVQVSGTGRVIEQFPPPGRRRRPAECRIVLSHETGPGQRSPR